MPLRELDPHVIAYNAAVSACETGGQWQQALTKSGHCEYQWLSCGHDQVIPALLLDRKVVFEASRVNMDYRYR